MRVLGSLFLHLFCALITAQRQAKQDKTETYEQSCKSVDQLDPQSLFVCVSTSYITWINKSLAYNCKQIGPNKRSAYRIKKDFISTFSITYR